MPSAEKAKGMPVFCARQAKDSSSRALTSGTRSATLHRPVSPRKPQIAARKQGALFSTLYPAALRSVAPSKASPARLPPACRRMVSSVLVF